MTVPAIRIRALNTQPVRGEREFVLYWMTSFRRLRSNFALDRAIEHARHLKQPLLVLEALRIGYPFANERLHAFVLQGMRDNAERAHASALTHFAYVEPEPGRGAGLLEALGARASVVVGDDWPCFFVPRMQAAAANKLTVRFEVVDSNGLYPMRDTTRVFTTAHSFRTHLQKELPPHLHHFPRENALEGLRLPKLGALPKAVLTRWPLASAALLDAQADALARLPIDHQVKPVRLRGGSVAAEARLALFVRERLEHYPEQRNEPELDGTSMLSAALHFGHLSTHQVFSTLARAENWSIDRLGKSIGGAREGWWKLSRAGEAWVDQFVTWRELAFNLAALAPDSLTDFDSLPRWALETMREHERDTRPKRYSLRELEQGRTHDPLWNAAQMQLVRDGWFHNYLRMLWGKKIYEWSANGREALSTMETLMGRYSLDGRDPVSWSGYMWVLGRYDRAWGPERPIFGKLRYMSSDNTAKKLSVAKYVERYHP